MRRLFIMVLLVLLAVMVYGLYTVESGITFTLGSAGSGGSSSAGGSSSVVGAPTISAALIERVLTAYHSPAAGESQSLYDLGVQYGIDPAFALAFFMHESSFGTQGWGAENHSLGNIRCSAGYSCNGGYRYYADWSGGFQDWYSLIKDGYVGGSVSSACPCRTVEQIIPVYAPAADHNDESGYVHAVEHAVAVWHSGQVVVS